MEMLRKEKHVTKIRNKVVKLCDSGDCFYQTQTETIVSESSGINSKVLSHKGDGETNNVIIVTCNTCIFV